MDTTKCDFCAGQPVTHVLPVKDFTLGPVASKGLWGSCRDCARFIFRGDWNSLTTRSINSFALRTGRPMLPEEQEAVKSLHQEVQTRIAGRLHPA